VFCFCCFVVLFCVCSAKVGIQSLMLAGQVLHHLSHALNPLFCFLKQVLIRSLGWLGSSNPPVSGSRVWDYRHAPPHIVKRWLLTHEMSAIEHDFQG
jgi:hypothetical protein